MLLVERRGSPTLRLAKGSAERAKPTPRSGGGSGAIAHRRRECVTLGLKYTGAHVPKQSPRRHRACRNPRVARHVESHPPPTSRSSAPHPSCSPDGRPEWRKMDVLLSHVHPILPTNLIDNNCSEISQNAQLERTRQSLAHTKRHISILLCEIDCEQMSQTEFTNFDASPR